MKRIDLYKKFVELKRPLLLDGAMGTYLAQQNIPLHPHLWYSLFNLHNPKQLKKIHMEYIDAGAEIITTNTFRTNPIAVKKANLEITNYEFVKKSVAIALEARRELNVIVAGSNAPAEDCYQKERSISALDIEYNHKKHIEMLWESGVDIIWNETQSHWDEIEIISKYCNENRLPFVISIYFDDQYKLLSGESLTEVINFISGFNPIAIGFNCVKPKTFQKYFKSNDIQFKFGFYFNCGLSSVNEIEIKSCIDPDEYAKSVKNLINYNTVFIGSCCGSSPKHTEKLKELLDAAY